MVRQKCKFHFLSTEVIRIEEEEGKEIEVELAFKVNERQFWITRLVDGTCWVEERSIFAPCKIFSTSISGLLCPERLERFLCSKIYQLGIRDQFANELRVGFQTYVKEKASRAVERPLKSLIVTARVDLYTEYLLDESWMIYGALRESENLNYGRGFGAVPATETAIASALAPRTIKKDTKNKN